MKDKLLTTPFSIRGRQKIKRNVRRYLRLLPAHVRLTKWDKLYKKRAFQNKARTTNDKQ